MVVCSFDIFQCDKNCAYFKINTCVLIGSSVSKSHHTHDVNKNKTLAVHQIMALLKLKIQFIKTVLPQYYFCPLCFFEQLMHHSWKFLNNKTYRRLFFWTLVHNARENFGTISKIQCVIIKQRKIKIYTYTD